MITKGSRTAVLNHIQSDDNYDAIYGGWKKGPGGTRIKLNAAVDEDGTIPKYYLLNQTGNIMISSTAKNDVEVPDAVKEMFTKAIVFFGAWTAALQQKDKTLQDYKALSDIISASGFFVKTHEEDRKFSYASADMTLDTAIVGSVLSGFSSMGATAALSIAQTVIGSIGNELNVAVESKDTEKKVGHLLFICENLMGMPLVTCLLFNTTAKNAEQVTSSNCHKTVTKEVKLTFHQDTYMFVDPGLINKYTKEFESNPEFKALVDRLAGYVK